MEAVVTYLARLSRGGVSRKPEELEAETLRFGRATNAEVYLADPRVRLEHAVLHHRPGGIFVEAPVYGFGESEQVVGRAVREYGSRDRVVLATKCGLKWDDNGIYRDSEPERLEMELHDSLRRLRTDYIDIYQVH